jgi:hypothetical protein
MRDAAFLRDYGDVIESKYFDYDYLSSLVRITQNLVTKHSQIPSQATLVEEIREFCESYHIKKDEQENIIEKVRVLYSINLLDTEAVKERVIRFGKRQALKSAVMQIADIIDNDSEFDNVSSIINDALLIGSNTNQLGLKLFGSFSSLHNLNGKKHGAKIATLFPDLDRALYGGPSRGEVWIVMGLPGHGKSQLLKNFGVAAIFDGVPVVHITIGDLDEFDCGVRYSARLSRCTMWDVSNRTSDYIRKAGKLDALLDRYLRIKYFSSYSVTMSMIRSYLSRLIAVDGIRPGMVIVDYPDEIRPYSDNDYQNMDRIYGELNALASDFNVLVWAASQPKRWRPERETDVMQMDNIADSWRKAAKADGIISLNMTPFEREIGRARLWLDKVRRGKSCITIPIVSQLDRCLLRQCTEDEAEKYRMKIESHLSKQRRSRNKPRSNGKGGEPKEE